MANYKSYQIFSGDLHITNIQTKGAREATIYACGILEGWRYAGKDGCKKRHQGLIVIDEEGRTIFERKYNS